MPMAVTYTVCNGEILAENRNGVRKAYVPDSLGSTIALRDSTGAITDTWEYWPYGEVRTRTGTTPTPFQYVGTLGYYTDATGNLYVRARSYQPKTTRWMSVDPLWPWEEAYGYVSLSPSNGIDPSGLQSRRRGRPWNGIPLMPPNKRKPVGLRGSFMTFAYGQYCGAANVKNPAWSVLPQDCIDDCCLTHDRCIEAHYGAGNSEGIAHRCCDYDLADCVMRHRLEGCCDCSPMKNDCQSAAIQIYLAMSFIGCWLFQPLDPNQRPCIPKNQWNRYVPVHWWNPYSPDPVGYGGK